MADGSANQGSGLGLRVAPGPRAPSQVRDHLIALRSLVQPDLFDQVELLVNELVTNSVRHGHLDDGDWVEVRVTASKRTVRVTVIDPGSGFAPRSPQPSLEDTSGWGLYLVDQLADRWGVIRNGNTVVWFELDRG
jgi:anti-sigma regulatory factor (Ser/Thr protein kinase)